jgi:hypothetical protein
MAEEHQMHKRTLSDGMLERSKSILCSADADDDTPLQLIKEPINNDVEPEYEIDEYGVMHKIEPLAPEAYTIAEQTYINIKNDVNAIPFSQLSTNLQIKWYQLGILIIQKVTELC